jgi:peroxiredoxin
VRAAAAAFTLALGLALAFGCDRASQSGETAPAEPARAEAAPAPAPAAAEPARARSRNERPLPAFSGTTLDGQSLAASSFLGRRLVIFFFDASKSDAQPAGQAVAALLPLQGKHNFRVLGVASGASENVRAYVEQNRLGEVPVLDDATGAIGRRFGLEISAAYVVVDAEGYVVGGMGAVATGAEDPAAALEGALREQLRLPAAAMLLEPGLGEHPVVPDFRAEPLAGGEPFTLASLRGKPAVLMFFLYTCPHCHAAMRALKQLLPELPEASRPVLIGLSVGGAPSTVQQELAKHGLDFFPVMNDSDRAIARRLGSEGGVPDILLLDAQGRVQFRTHGWRDDRDPALMRMKLARLAGAPVPMLLHQTGYSGNEFCAVCHESQAETWRFSDHARAFDTLVRHSADRNDECVSCHVVGFGKPGGYAIDPPTPHFENVGCETCHGRGGPHLSPPAPAAAGSYESTCVTCHDPKHSLGFDYATFLPKVSHSANAGLLALPPGEKRARIAALGERRPALFPDAEYVGSAVCQTCHTAEHQTWSNSGHGRALVTLEQKGKASDAGCLRCHTTGFDKGGFPAGGTRAAHADLAAVGCESCHGPGGDHVKEGARRAGTIVSLGDKCDSCVILQICGECHDDANDPGFEYEVKDKIEAQRHGTIEPGTGKPKAGAAALLDGPPLARLALLEYALAAGGGR